MSAQINFLKNNNGLGIVEVLVAVGLVAIVSVGIMAMISNANKSQRGIQGKDMQREVIAEIRTLLNNRTACLNSFGGGNPSAPFTRASIKDSANVDRFVVGTNDKSNLLRYTEFQIEDWIPDAGYTTQGNVSLSIALTKEGDVSGVREIKQKITLKIKRITAGGITECFSIGSSSDGLWQVSPANPSNIYYSAGNVGVGTDSPVSKLDVAGGIRPGSAGVAIGGACTHEGTFAYDLVAHKPVYCNDGLRWIVIGESAVPRGTLCGFWANNPGGPQYSQSGVGCMGAPSGVCPTGYTWTVMVVNSIYAGLWYSCVKN